MNGPLTVKDLYENCRKLMDAGLGDKTVLISNDDEGNGFHSLYFAFLTDPNKIGQFATYFHDGNDPKEVVLLG